MNHFHVAAALLILAALASYLNHRYIRLPATIGMMVISLIGSMTIVTLSHIDLIDPAAVKAFIRSLDFGDLLLHGMLGFMLFAGALHINLESLRSVRTPVVILASIGVVIATLITGTLFWYLCRSFGYPLPYLYALVFGALISPTDPIAVTGVLKRVRTPERLRIKIAGEALFNDGIAVVLFTTLLGIANGTTTPDGAYITQFLFREVIGGIVTGLALGSAAFRMIRSVDAYQVEILLTLALVASAYSLAEIIGVSAPIAVVTAGLLIGNHGRKLAMSRQSRQRLDTFWELIDEFLNALLFVLIGLEVIALRMNLGYLLIGLLTIIAVLGGRLISVWAPITLLGLRRRFLPGTVRILTWAGLRGGISIALALSLPISAERELILSATYIVVIFSVLVQGLTIGRMARTLSPPMLTPPPETGEG